MFLPVLLILPRRRGAASKSPVMCTGTAVLIPKNIPQSVVHSEQSTPSAADPSIWGKPAKTVQETHTYDLRTQRPDGPARQTETLHCWTHITFSSDHLWVFNAKVLGDVRETLLDHENKRFKRDLSRSLKCELMEQRERRGGSLSHESLVSRHQADGASVSSAPCV